MSLVAENADGEDDEDADGKENDSSVRSKQFIQHLLSHKSFKSSYGSETSGAPRNNDVTCFLDLLDNSRGSSNDQEDSSKGTVGNDMHAKQDFLGFGQSHQIVF